MATGRSHRTPGTLPPQTSGFVGREAELARARELLRQSRLVTVTGPGGVGKTRLAVRAAGEAASGFRDGAHIIELSAVHDPGLLAHTLAARLTVAELSNAASDEGSQLDRLLGFLSALYAAGAAAPLDHVIERALDDDDQLGEPAGPGS
jgi:hypothetical protein